MPWLAVPDGTITFNGVASIAGVELASATRPRFTFGFDPCSPAVRAYERAAFLYADLGFRTRAIAKARLTHAIDSSEFDVLERCADA